MRMNISLSLIQEEIDSVFGHDIVEVYGINETQIDLRSCPEEWVGALASYDTSIEDLMIDKWRNTSKFPRFSSALKRKLHRVYLAHNKLSGKCFLLYVFTCRNEVIIFVGNAPYSGNSENEGILKYLEPVCSVHDGYYLLSGGVIHLCGRQEILEEMAQMGSNGFMKIFQCNVDWVGFGLNDSEIKPYIIWSGDEEVEEIDDIYEEIDDWLATRITDYDDLTNED